MERVKVVEDRKQPADEAVRVFVLFTSELSALRGVNSLNSRLFGGRKYVHPYAQTDLLESKPDFLTSTNLRKAIFGDHIYMIILLYSMVRMQDLDKSIVCSEYRELFPIFVDCK